MRRSPADLKAAGSKLSKVAQEAKGDTALQAKIADLLSRQPALNGVETSESAPLETLVSGLVPLSRATRLRRSLRPTVKMTLIPS